MSLHLLKGNQISCLLCTWSVLMIIYHKYLTRILNHLHIIIDAKHRARKKNRSKTEKKSTQRDSSSRKKKLLAPHIFFFCSFSLLCMCVPIVLASSASLILNYVHIASVWNVRIIEFKQWRRECETRWRQRCFTFDASVYFSSFFGEFFFLFPSTHIDQCIRHHDFNHTIY